MGGCDPGRGYDASGGLMMITLTEKAGAIGIKSGEVEILIPGEEISRIANALTAVAERRGLREGSRSLVPGLMALRGLEGDIYPGDDREVRVSILTDEGIPFPLFGCSVWFTGLDRLRVAEKLQSVIDCYVSISEDGSIGEERGLVECDPGSGLVVFGFEAPDVTPGGAMKGYSRDVRDRAGIVEVEVQVKNPEGSLRTVGRDRFRVLAGFRQRKDDEYGDQEHRGSRYGRPYGGPVGPYRGIDPR
jgi:hypothetical protein